MKKRMLSFAIMVAVLIASFSALTAFAATETLDITPATLRTLNGADGKEGADAAQGATYQAIGDWHWTGGETGVGTNDYLMPFDEAWTHSGTDAHIVMMNYGCFILIAKDIDLSKYSKATISYSTDATFTSSENEIGFFSEGASFGSQDNRLTDGLLASGKTTPAVDGGSWNAIREMEIDLSDVDYKGDLYLAHYMKEPNGVCVTNIEFTLAEGSQGGDSTGDNDNQGGQTGNTETGDMSFALIVAAAAAVITVLFRKKSMV